MKTMYRAEIRVYTDCEGRYSGYEPITEYTTEVEARKAVENVDHHFPRTGDWCIMARTIDEEAFTVTDTVVEEFNWWKEVGRKEEAQRDLEYAKEAIERAKAIKAKTERGEARKAKAIAEAEQWYADAEAIINA